MSLPLRGLAVSRLGGLAWDMQLCDSFVDIVREGLQWPWSRSTRGLVRYGYEVGIVGWVYGGTGATQFPDFAAALASL